MAVSNLHIQNVSVERTVWIKDQTACLMHSVLKIKLSESCEGTWKISMSLYQSFLLVATNLTMNDSNP